MHAHRTVDYTPETRQSANNTTTPTMSLTVMAANVAATSTAGDHARFIHQALCSPPTPLLLRTLPQSSELTTIPGLTTHLISHHLPPSTTTDKGLMQRHRQGVHFTHTQQLAILQARSNVDRLRTTKQVAPHTTCFATQPCLTCTPGLCTLMAPVPSPCDHSATCTMCLWPTFMT
jgi:hypothetical protein